MRKALLYFSLLAATGAGLTSCNNGDYDANPDTDNSSTTNPLDSTNNGGGGSGGGGGGGGNNGNSYNWSGTDPISAKINGVQWVGQSAYVQGAGGFNSISGSNGMLGGTAVNASMSIVIGSLNTGTYTFGGSSSASWIPNSAGVTQTTGIYASGFGGGGGLKIIESDATHVKGLFYFNGKFTDGSQSADITEGYFNIPR